MKTYLAHPPKTDPALKEQLMDALGPKVIDPFSLSPDLESQGDPEQRSQLAPLIFARNVQAIYESEWVVALASSQNPFDPDQGVFWELGFARALGKPTLIVVQEPLTFRDPFPDAAHYLRFLKNLSPLVVTLEALPKIWNLYREVGLEIPAFPPHTPAAGATIFHWQRDAQQLPRAATVQLVSYESPLFYHGLHFQLIAQPRPSWICIDDRPAMASFLAGWLYGHQIPFWTWSAQGHGSNIMIAQSSCGHFSNWSEFQAQFKFWQASSTRSQLQLIMD